MKKMLIMLMLGVALMMVPISASATFLSDRASWEAAVGTYSDVYIPGDDGDTLAAYTYIALPGGEYVRFNQALDRVDVGATKLLISDYLSGDNYLAAANFFPDTSSSAPDDRVAVSAFGFDIAPVHDAQYQFLLYTTVGTISESIDGSVGPTFLGWTGDDVLGFSLIAYGSGALGIEMSNLVQGVAPVPEPATMLLLGSGLVGLVGLRRKFRKG